MAPQVLYREDSAQLFLSEADDFYRNERDEKPMSHQDSIAQVIAGSDDNDCLHRASCEDMLKYHPYLAAAVKEALGLERFSGIAAESGLVQFIIQREDTGLSRCWLLSSSGLILVEVIDGRELIVGIPMFRVRRVEPRRENGFVTALVELEADVSRQFHSDSGSESVTEPARYVLSGTDDAGERLSVFAAQLRCSIAGLWAVWHKERPPRQ
jgi:hypothetical protein